MTARAARRCFAGFVLVVATSIIPQHADAGTGLRTAFWSGSAFSIQQGSNNNVVGYWRMLLQSMNRCPGTVSSSFTASLRAETISTQQTWLTYNPSFSTSPADGIINQNDWNALAGWRSCQRHGSRSQVLWWSHS